MFHPNTNTLKTHRNSARGYKYIKGNLLKSLLYSSQTLGLKSKLKNTWNQTWTNSREVSMQRLCNNKKKTCPLWSKLYGNLLCKVEQKVNTDTQKESLDVSGNCSSSFKRSSLPAFQDNNKPTFHSVASFFWSESQLSPLQWRIIVGSKAGRQSAERYLLFFLQRIQKEFSTMITPHTFESIHLNHGSVYILARSGMIPLLYGTRCSIEARPRFSHLYSSPQCSTS